MAEREINAWHQAGTDDSLLFSICPLSSDFFPSKQCSWLAFYSATLQSCNIYFGFLSFLFIFFPQQASVSLQLITTVVLSFAFITLFFSVSTSLSLSLCFCHITIDFSLSSLLVRFFLCVCSRPSQTLPDQPPPHHPRSPHPLFLSPASPLFLSLLPSVNTVMAASGCIGRNGESGGGLGGVGGLVGEEGWVKGVELLWWWDLLCVGLLRQLQAYTWYSNHSNLSAATPDTWLWGGHFTCCTLRLVQSHICKTKKKISIAHMSAQVRADTCTHVCPFARHRQGCLACPSSTRRTTCC